MTNCDDDLALRNHLRDSTALLDYAAKLAAVPVPDPVTRCGALALAKASIEMMAVYRTLGVPVDSKGRVA